MGQIKSDLKAEIKAEMSAASYNGSLHLGQSKYNLVNTKLIQSKDNSSTIDADVAEPKLNTKNTAAATVGHITFTTSRHENSTIGVGTLSMNSGQYSGQYKVLLEMRPEKMWHNGPHAFAEKNVKVEIFGTTKDVGAKRKIV